MAVGTLSTSFLLESCANESKSPNVTYLNQALSQRGQEASKSVLRIDFDLYFEATKNLFHKVKNPEGAFPLNVAENKMSWPMLRMKMEEIARKNTIEDWVANYTESTGSPTFRNVMAEFLSTFLTKCPVDPDHLCMSPGATSVIDLTSWILGEPGDVAVFPAPCYSVYKQDIGNKAGLERYDLVTHHELSELQNGPPLTVQHLVKAYNEIKNQGKRLRILVITNPDNPTGGIYSKDQLTQYTDWCLENNIHLIVNEIYGLSLIDTQHPELRNDYQQDVPFYSFANIMQERKSDYLHHWYALSKDFGASGFRVGFVYSLNKSFIQAYQNLNAPSMVSNHTQWIFEQVLKDHAFVEKYIKTNQQLLTGNYVTVIQTLKKLKIPYAPARGSLFAWLDLSELLEENTQEGESKFWMELYRNTGILLTPGDGFGHSKRGQFRLVYAYVMNEELEVAMKRFTRYIEKSRIS